MKHHVCKKTKLKIQKLYLESTLKSHFRHRITKTQNPNKILLVANQCFVGFRDLVFWWHFSFFYFFRVASTFKNANLFNHKLKSWQLAVGNSNRQTNKSKIWKVISEH
jgi:hypothetical protein